MNVGKPGEDNIMQRPSRSCCSWSGKNCRTPTPFPPVGRENREAFTKVRFHSMRKLAQIKAAEHRKKIVSAILYKHSAPSWNRSFGESKLVSDKAVLAQTTHVTHYRRSVKQVWCVVLKHCSAKIAQSQQSSPANHWNKRNCRSIKCVHFWNNRMTEKLYTKCLSFSSSSTNTFRKPHMNVCFLHIWNFTIIHIQNKRTQIIASTSNPSNAQAEHYARLDLPPSLVLRNSLEHVPKL